MNRGSRGGRSPNPKAGVPERERRWMELYPSGLCVDPTKLRPKDINIEDIAHSLSMLCRYTGHVSRFYCVAEHCVRVSWLVQAYGCAARVQLRALLHDASEAYLGDMGRPLKHSGTVEGYRAVERALEPRIYRRFGLDGGENLFVAEADMQMLGPEVATLKAKQLDRWKAKWPKVNYKPDPTMGWSPDSARTEYLRRFDALMGAVHGAAVGVAL